MKIFITLAQIVRSFDGIIDHTVGIIDHNNGIIDHADGIIGYIERILDQYLINYQQNCSCFRQYGSMILSKLVNTSISMAGIKDVNVLLKTLITRKEPYLVS